MLQRILRDHSEGQSLVKRFTGPDALLFNSADGKVISHVLRYKGQTYAERISYLRQVCACVYVCACACARVYGGFTYVCMPRGAAGVVAGVICVLCAFGYLELVDQVSSTWSEPS
jgi:hypothetical protein